jgi:hypothetical protein
MNSCQFKCLAVALGTGFKLASVSRFFIGCYDGKCMRKRVLLVREAVGASLMTIKSRFVKAVIEPR